LLTVINRLNKVLLSGTTPQSKWEYWQQGMNRLQQANQLYLLTGQGVSKTV